jgi:hypothetical protein
LRAFRFSRKLYRGLRKEHAPNVNCDTDGAADALLRARKLPIGH